MVVCGSCSLAWKGNKLRLIHIIVAADVGSGVYRHKFGSQERSLLVAIAQKFGGIGPKDIGKKVYLASDGQLVWEGAK